VPYITFVFVWFLGFPSPNRNKVYSVPHAGETGGPASVWGALQILGAERIGHGVRAIEDPSLVAYLKDQHISLEVCPTSNICLSVYPTLMQHSLPQLHTAGIPITVNSDDPALFNTTLTQEITLLFDAFQFDLDTVNDLLLNGVRYSFLPLEEKRAMEATFQAEMARLERELAL
jgi:aminodeoxyfutalosine deaminase